PNGNVYVAVLNTGAAPVLLKTLILTIDINNEAPVADFSASIIRGNASLTVDFDATASHDKGSGQVTLFEWDWDGDGSYDQSGSSSLAQHVFSKPGIYTVGLRVTD